MFATKRMHMQHCIAYHTWTYVCMLVIVIIIAASHGERQKETERERDREIDKQYNTQWVSGDGGGN